MTEVDIIGDNDDYLLTLTTESSNASSDNLDSLSTLERLQRMNAEDTLAAHAVAKELEHIAAAVELIIRSFKGGGRLIYVGAGTSGRLGVLDAVECPPTFGTDPNKVVAIIAGGQPAIYSAVEGAEDSSVLGAASIDNAQVNHLDTVVGISASGQAPFVIGALIRANELAASTIALTNNRPSRMEKHANITIAPIVGPEFISGSTRLKSGTSQKMVLNMLTTNAMIGIGKTYGNLMVDVKATNSKLRARALRIVRQVTGVDTNTALAALNVSENNAKLAILQLKTGLDSSSAAALLVNNGGFLRRALSAHAREREH